MNKEEISEEINKLVVKANRLGIEEGKADILEKCCDKCYNKLKQEKV